MASLTFRQLLTRPDATGCCRIFLDVTWPKNRVKKPTGVSCLPQHFSATAKSGRWITGKDASATDGNTKLARLFADVAELFRIADAHGVAVSSAQVLAIGKEEPAPEAAAVATAKDVADLTFTELLVRWQEEHPTANFNSRRRYNQVATHLETYHPGLTLAQLTRVVFLNYQVYLVKHDYAESTISQHVKFLRACFRLADKTIPAWLVVKARYGRAVALRKEEFQALAAVELPPDGYLQRERERVLFQTLTLLRDSDLRQLKPHHVSEQDVPGHGKMLVLEFHQVKTGDEVRLPLPPLAAGIWKWWEGKVPLISQQKRNEYIKELGRVAGLDRPFVKVTFRGDRIDEEAMPVWQAMSTHTPRHTGADLVLLGSDGDQNLKEVALGHLAGASVYGYDTMDRYGPLFLKAWVRVVGAMGQSAPTPGGNGSGKESICAAVPAIIRPVSARFLS